MVARPCKKCLAGFIGMRHSMAAGQRPRFATPGAVSNCQRTVPLYICTCEACPRDSCRAVFSPPPEPEPRLKKIIFLSPCFCRVVWPCIPADSLLQGKDVII